MPGTPTQSELSGISLINTDPAPTITFLPIFEKGLISKLVVVNFMSKGKNSSSTPKFPLNSIVLENSLMTSKLRLKLFKSLEASMFKTALPKS